MFFNSKTNIRNSNGQGMKESGGYGKNGREKIVLKTGRRTVTFTLFFVFRFVITETEAARSDSAQFSRIRL